MTIRIALNVHFKSTGVVSKYFTNCEIVYILSVVMHAVSGYYNARQSSASLQKNSTGPLNRRGRGGKLPDGKRKQSREGGYSRRASCLINYDTMWNISIDCDSKQSGSNRRLLNAKRCFEKDRRLPGWNTWSSFHIIGDNKMPFLQRNSSKRYSQYKH